MVQFKAPSKRWAGCGSGYGQLLVALLPASAHTANDSLLAGGRASRTQKVRSNTAPSSTKNYFREIGARAMPLVWAIYACSEEIG